MFVHVARRAQIGEVLSGRRSLSYPPLLIKHWTELPRLEPQAAAAIWSSDPTSSPRLPEVLVTPDGQERDWLAWLVTFAPNLRPFTAFCRVMGTSNFSERLAAFQVPSLGRLEGACLGLILGEVLSSENVLARPRDPISAAGCASLLSFALVRELAVYRTTVAGNHDLVERWSFVRQLTRQRERGAAVRDIASVAGVLRTLHRGEGGADLSVSVVRACEALIEQREPLALHGLPLMEAAREMSGIREERVAVFERALELGMSAAAAPEVGFSLGYLASRINPGTLSHAPLLVPALRRHPSAMMWYGVCAGLAPESNIAAELGGVGRRVLRDLLFDDGLVSRPRTDIAATELEILVGGDRAERADDFVVSSPSQLSIELEAGVSMVVGLSPRGRAQQSPDIHDRPEERAWIAQELTSAITRLIDLQRRVRGEPREGGAEQRVLFDEQGTQRRKPRRL